MIDLTFVPRKILLVQMKKKSIHSSQLFFFLAVDKKIIITAVLSG